MPAVAQDLYPRLALMLRMLLEMAGRLLWWHLIGLRLAVGAAGPRRGKGQTGGPPTSNLTLLPIPWLTTPRVAPPSCSPELREPVAGGARILPLI